MSEETHIFDAEGFALQCSYQVKTGDPNGTWRSVIARELAKRDELMRLRFEQEKTLAAASMPRAIVEIWPGDKVILESDNMLTANSMEMLQNQCTKLCPGVKFIILDRGTRVSSVVHTEGESQ